MADHLFLLSQFHPRNSDMIVLKATQTAVLPVLSHCVYNQHLVPLESFQRHYNHKRNLHIVGVLKLIIFTMHRDADDSALMQ